MIDSISLISKIENIVELCCGRNNYYRKTHCHPYYTHEFVKNNKLFRIKYNFSKDNTVKFNYIVECFINYLSETELHFLADEIETIIYKWFPDLNVVNNFKIINKDLKVDTTNYDLANLTEQDKRDEIENFISNYFSNAIVNKCGWQGDRNMRDIMVGRYAENNNLYKVIIIDYHNKIEVDYNIKCFEEDKEETKQKIQNFRNKFYEFLLTGYDKKQIKEFKSYENK